MGPCGTRWWCLAAGVLWLLTGVLSACEQPLADVCAGNPMPESCRARVDEQVRPDAAAATCGNGILEAGEDCDDGAACEDGRDCTRDRFRCGGSVPERACQPRDGDGCSASCQYERSRPGSVVTDASLPVASGTDAGAMPLERPDAADERPDASRDATAAAPSREGNDAGVSGAPDTSALCSPSNFGTPQLLSGFQVSGSLWSPAYSPGESRLYFAMSSAEGEALGSAQRLQGSTFGAAQLLSVNSSSEEGTPFLSADGLSLFFYSTRPGGAGSRDLWVAERASFGSEFGEPSALESINGEALDHLPWVSPQQDQIVFVSTRAGGVGQSDLWSATRNTPAEPFANAALLPGVNTSQDEGRAALTADALTIIFSSSRAGGAGSYDLWLATRESTAEGFASPTALDALNSAARDMDPFLSPDGTELVFASDRAGSVQLYRAELNCP